jgi:NADH:ubiquinone oxidoreductase subunit E
MIKNKNAPTSKIAKKLNKILKQQLQMENQYNTQNSENLAHSIATIKINESHRTITFDIKDLYVNIPIEETLKITEQQLRKGKDKNKTNQIITTLHTILKQNYFEYQDTIYHPNKGVAMGSPISGTIAEIFLQHIENNQSNNYWTPKL